MSSKIAVISDTHGSVTAWSKARQIWKGSNMIIHLGDVLYHGPRNPIPEGYMPKELAEEINSSDIPVMIVRGNCDADIDTVMLKWPIANPYLVMWWNDKLILASHGTDFERDKSVALSFGADLMLVGHTHVCSLAREGRTIFLNPGSVSLPKGREPASLALIDMDAISILSMDGIVIYHESWDLR